MKYLSTLILVLITAPCVYALPQMDALVGRAVPRAKLQHSRDCTNFTGLWKGMCTVKGQAPKADFLRVSQTGCGVVAINSEALILGGTNQTALSIPVEKEAVNIQFVLSADWTEENKAIQLGLAGSTKVLNRAGLYPFNGTGRISLLDDKLKYEMKVLDYEVECSYDKDL